MDYETLDNFWPRWIVVVVLLTMISGTMFIFGWSLTWWGMAILGVCNTLIVVWLYKHIARVRRYVTMKESRVCPKCHFDLSAHEPSGECPECGHAFTPAQLEEAWRFLGGARKSR
jgi:uncharacterized paraquat-inducible protein A